MASEDHSASRAWRARMSSIDRSRWAVASILAAAAAVYLLLAWPGAGERGIFAEEVQPYLERYPVVLERRPATAPESAPAIVPMPPYEPGAPSRPRWVATSQWPVIAYDGESRIWPLFLRGHQTALGTYVALGLRPLLGGGIAGARRATVLLGLAVVLLSAAMAARLRAAPDGMRQRDAHVATGVTAALLAASFGVISIARTAESFEVASRVAMLAALLPLAARAPPRLAQAVWAALWLALAVLCRGTIVVAVAPAALLLLARDGARPSRRAAATIAVVGLGLPVLVVAISHTLVPFRAAHAPLADFPIASVPERLLGLHRQLLICLAWLGDATSVFAPLALGRASLGASLWLPAAIAAVPVVAASVRLWCGTAATGERLLLVTLASCVLAGTVLYGVPDQFQLALGVEPFFAMAIADQVVAVLRAGGLRFAAVAAAVALAVRVHGAHRGLSLDALTANPMMSGLAQRAAAARMTELGLYGPEVMTTVYNQAGVIEGWTEGNIRPVHAWHVLSAPPAPADCAHQAVWRDLLRLHQPRYVLLTEGPNLYESGGMDPPAVARSLTRVATLAGIRVTTDRRFPTESGGPGWALLALEYPDAITVARRAFPVDGACKESRAPEPIGLSTYRGLSRGDLVGGFVIEAIEPPRDPRRPVRLTLRRGEDTATFELRPQAEVRSPPGRGGGLAVTYRNDDTPRVAEEALVAAAVALGEALEAASPTEERDGGDGGGEVAPRPMD